MLLSTLRRRFTLMLTNLKVGLKPPIPTSSNRFKSEFFQPAIQGTVGMLKSALKNGCALLLIFEDFSPDRIYYSTNVKRIVVTSSCASVMSPPAVPTKYSEEDWNEISPKEVEEQGSKAPPMTIYRASKTLAERGKPR